MNSVNNIYDITAIIPVIVPFIHWTTTAIQSPKFTIADIIGELNNKNNIIVNITNFQINLI